MRPGLRRFPAFLSHSNNADVLCIERLNSGYWNNSPNVSIIIQLRVIAVAHMCPRPREQFDSQAAWYLFPQIRRYPGSNNEVR